MSLRIRLARSRPIRLLGGIAKKCWAFSGAYVLACFLLYWLYGGIFAFFLLCFAITGILYHTEDKLLYHPELPPHSRVYVPAPSMFSLPYQSVYTRSGDGTMLHMFFISQTEEKAKKVPTLLFFHGNAGNMGHRLQNVARLYRKLGCNILMLEYRGYGLSQGSPSEEGLYMDARAGLDYLSTRTDINNDEIIVFGRSLGGGVAIDLAMRPDYAKKIWCLILENTFTSIPDMASLLIGSKILQYLPLFIYKNKVRVQILIVMLNGDTKYLLPFNDIFLISSLVYVTTKNWLCHGTYVIYLRPSGHSGTALIIIIIIIIIILLLLRNCAA
ncbi:protein ABHD13 isoform X2 [Neodiprion fabricii]|uniref:protein ABHD13 isoform X2 n=1 Tax=Neodiprion fabricii TaxID=2872261 RepID=UPI001ED9827A|nr:protein ABHD13 isoform X2 [Neodiprion fabricii]